MTPDSKGYLIPVERIEHAIIELRGERVMLDADLAALYGTTTKRLNEQVKRNLARFPGGFLFQLTEAEKDELVAKCDRLARLKHSSTLPNTFTEHGAVMAAMVLKSSRATEVSVFVVRVFVRMRRMLAGQRQLALKLAELESKLAVHDKNFRVVFEAIRRLMQPAEPKRHRIGFKTDDDTPTQTGSGSGFTVRDRPAAVRRRKTERKRQ